MNAIGQTIPVSQLMPQKSKRTVAVRKRNGDLAGGDWTIPKGDFAHFLGYKPQTAEESKGKVSGSRAIELAIRNKMQKIGEGAMQRGMSYRNMYISHGRFENEPGRERDMINSISDSISQSVEMGHAMGIRYLEMQYKFHMASKNFGCISNLMKTRHEATKKAVSEVR